MLVVGCIVPVADMVVGQMGASVGSISNHSGQNTKNVFPNTSKKVIIPDLY